MTVSTLFVSGEHRSCFPLIRTITRDALWRSCVYEEGISYRTESSVFYSAATMMLADEIKETGHVFYAEVDVGKNRSDACCIAGFDEHAKQPNHKIFNNDSEGISALAVMLVYGHFLPIKSAAEILESLTGLSVFDTTVENFCSSFGEKSRPFSGKIREALRQASVAHVDETDLRVKGHAHWLHSFSTEGLTAFDVHSKQGGQIMAETESCRFSPERSFVIVCPPITDSIVTMPIAPRIFSETRQGNNHEAIPTAHPRKTFNLSLLEAIGTESNPNRHTNEERCFRCLKRIQKKLLSLRQPVVQVMSILGHWLVVRRHARKSNSAKTICFRCLHF